MVKLENKLKYYHLLQNIIQQYQKDLALSQKELDIYQQGKRIGTISGIVSGSENQYGYIETPIFGTLLFYVDEYHSGRLTSELTQKKVIFDIEKRSDKYIPRNIVLLI